MDRNELLNRAKAALQNAFGERLRGVVLYGSEARGEAGPDSDVDLLVLLDETPGYVEDLLACIEVLYPLSEQIGRRISARPVPADEYENVECPLYQAAHREGIPA
jgi:predicted nucleotidyltransferase